MFKKAGDFKEAVSNYRLLVDIYQDSNRNTQAAKIFKEIAALEEEREEIDNAVKAWEEAVDCYDMVEQPANANQCRVSLAVLCSENDQLDKAAEIYEALGDPNATSGQNWKGPTYLWKAMLCHMVLEARKTGDLKESKDTLERHMDMSPKFHDCREAKLLTQIFAAYEQDSEDVITQAVYDYDRISKLEAWCTRMLLELKRILRDGASSKTKKEDSDVDSDDEFA